MQGALLDVALDLTKALSTRARFERLTTAVRQVVPCDAVALLARDKNTLRPIATHGLSPELYGRRFVIAEHPRLEAIMTSDRPVRFRADDPRPDPYDGMVLGGNIDLKVHSCMGCSLMVDGEVVGALTVDALAEGAFDAIDDDELASFAALAGAAMRTATLIDALEETAQHRERVNRQMVADRLASRDPWLGPSTAMAAVQREVESVARTDLTVLILGETGTGKELVARALHAGSDRAARPLVHVNCAALPESLADSELFGHVKGAFTSAHKDRAGRFELAHHGTLFLDEIGELPLALQPKLLRALQFGQLQRVGSDRTIEVDVRIIAATNRDLMAEVKANRFRADLYHRLSVYPIHIPALRQRLEDLPSLVQSLLGAIGRQLGTPALTLEPAALEQLHRYGWPGNVRELEHLLMRAAVRARQHDRHIGTMDPQRPVVIGPSDLDGLDEPVAPATHPLPPSDAVEELGLPEATRQFQRSLIVRTLEATEGNWSEAARRLRVDRSNLMRTGRRLGVSPPPA